MNSNNVILTPKAQWSLILFLGSFVINIASMWVVGSASKITNIDPLIVLIPPFFTILVYLASVLLGLASLKTSKFPLTLVIPCSLLLVVLTYTATNDFYRLLKSDIETVGYQETIASNKGIGVSISQNPEAPTVISAVFYNSPAEKAGLRNGDKIILIEDFKVNSLNDIVKTLNSIETDNVKVTINRNGGNKVIEVNRHNSNLN